MRGGGHSANDAPQAHVLSGFTLESSRTIIAEVLRERARLCDATLFHVTWLTQSALAASLTLPFDCAADLDAAAQTLRLYSGWLRGSLPRCFADDPVGARNTVREAISQLALLFRRRRVAVGEVEGEVVDERAAMALGRAHERLCRRALDTIDESSRDPLGPVAANAEHVLRTLLSICKILLHHNADDNVTTRLRRHAMQTLLMVSLRLTDRLVSAGRGALMWTLLTRSLRKWRHLLPVITVWSSELILFTVTFSANPANNYLLPLIYF